MSASEHRPVHAPAAKVDAEAAAWLDRRDCGGWSGADQAALDAWLEESPIHRITYWRMEAAWARAERLVALRPAQPRAWKGLALFRAVAAAAFAAALGMVGWSYLSQPSHVTYATSIGGRETVMLADGSRIELNTDTSIRLADRTDARTIWLEKGEAYFQITHDASRPLIVFVGDRRITDLGTKFVVRRERDKFDVAVVEGSVSLDAATAARQAKPLVLRPGDAAVATADNVSVSRKSTFQLSNELGWRRGVIVFDNMPLAEAAEQVSRYNPIKLKIADAKTGRLAVTGTVSATDPEEFLRMARTIFGLHAKKVDGAFVISR